MINVTENEALEALTGEEKYPAGIQPHPLPKPVSLAALSNDEGSKVKAQIWHIQQTSQRLPPAAGEEKQCTTSSHLHKSMEHIDKAAADSLLQETQSLSA